jgi:hypothetical protein
MPDTEDPQGNIAQRELFGRWLIAQNVRGDWVDDLASAARADRTFRKNGGPEAAHAHLRQQQVGWDTFQTANDAENDWLAS